MKTLLMSTDLKVQNVQYCSPYQKAESDSPNIKTKSPSKIKAGKNDPWADDLFNIIELFQETAWKIPCKYTANTESLNRLSVCFNVAIEGKNTITNFIKSDSKGKRLQGNNQEVGNQNGGVDKTDEIKTSQGNVQKARTHDNNDVVSKLSDWACLADGRKSLGSLSIKYTQNEIEMTIEPLKKHLRTFVWLEMYNLVRSEYSFNTCGIIVQSNYRAMPINLPYYKEDAVILLILNGLLMMLTTFLSFASFAKTLVHEKEVRTSIMMKLNGVEMPAYFFAKIVVSFVLVAPVLLTMYTISYISFNELVNHIHPAMFLQLIFLYTLAMCSFGYLFSSFFSSSKAVDSILMFTAVATICYIIYILLSIEMFILVSFLPLGAAFITLKEMLYFRIKGNTELTASFFFNPQNGLGLNLWIMMLLIPLHFLMGYYLENVLPKRYGARKPWYFPFTAVIRMIRGFGRNQPTGGPVIEETRIDLSGLPQDVLREQQFVDQGVDLDDYPLVVKNMTKKFAGTSKVAVNGVSFAVPKDTVFGLLGPNGAGKTTLISILTGFYQESSGQAYIGGFNTETQRDEIMDIVGFCPQHDILWKDISVTDHLLFYSRVKGIPRSEETKAVKKILEEFELTESAKKKSSKLSGGQRRRLSIAIALIGDPKVVFLDEPTTGLDPEVRREIWDLIQKARNGRVIVLTTHSMEEAEALCGKIGIMAHGKLKCIGALSELKKNYGKLFRIDFTSVDNKREEAKSHVQQILPSNAVCSSERNRSVSFQFYPESGDVARIFAAMIANSKNWHIIDWGVSQTTLDDIFTKCTEK